MVKDNEDDSSDDEMTIWDRQLALLCFAFYVVCAFTLVTFLNALLHPGWIGALESLGVLLFLSAFMSAMVLRVDFDSTVEHYQDDQKPFDLGPCGVVLFLLPCVWCCCPWLPLLWVLAGTTETLHVKEHWFQLIAMVAGLAASIDASSMLTLTTNAIAGSLGICNIKHCRHSWLFVLMQVVLAIATTAVLIPLIAPLAPSGHSNEQTRNQDDGEATTERQPLLRRIRNKLSRSAQSTRQMGMEAGGRSDTA